ncbi:DEAD/DEAH box helicase [Dictyobacter vulcani]|uniref:Type I restriction enzyme endonuclease subunit n=1 Tax=Dictyobacter vulcani TaxID=2607529 RepID=A0A5J4KF81_9CHLR|nr:type I restriction endonuclease subunit R [Dictyobacter vulcani]GER88044.1 DEAD/DEAH box helicase [Dictyobacter vulcani]
MQQSSSQTFDYEHFQQQLIQRAVDQFLALDYSLADAASEYRGPLSVTQRQYDSEVVLPERLWSALCTLNPGKSEQVLKQAFAELTRDLSLLGDIGANYQIHQWLKDGYTVTTGQSNGGWKSNQPDPQVEDDAGSIRIINWDEPEKNDFLLLKNFYVSGEIGRVRLDLVGFVNGLPLLMPFCRVARLYDLYTQDLSECKRIIPRLFWYNACIILSNGHTSKVGSVTANWEFFFAWNRRYNKSEDTVTQDQELDESIEHMLEGVFAQKRLLDIVENYTLFSTERGKTVKIIARNHQYLGVEAVFERLKRHQEFKGKLGVFWHTQGSGKSYSMAFLEQKVQRRLPGGWTFVIVTDREDLDTQIYETFQRAGVVEEKKNQAHASDSQHLQRMLQYENHKIVFTLIQKFRTEKPGQTYGQLSARQNIVVFADEAHRTQYATFAQNMLDGLPNASFIGFTGTPLIQQEEQATRAKFGEYVSVYNFSDAIKDRITVPLFYENHTPEMVLSNPDFAEAMKRLVIDRQLNDEQESKLSTQLLREYGLLTQDDRLEWVAEDIVSHFMQRGYMGKAMVVSIDKPTTVRMYEKVQRIWQREIASLEELHQREPDLLKRDAIAKRIIYMRDTDMAVIISDITPDDKRFDELGLDIAPHMRRLRNENLEEAFKREDNQRLLPNSGKKALRIAFVCGMWITGFDVPCLSTIYLDRPMEGHTLMQTIARANRVYDQEKITGLIIDYVGSFDQLLKALTIYAASDVNAPKDIQVGDKSELIKQLDSALSRTEILCQQHSIDIPLTLQRLDKARTLDERRAIIMDTADSLLVSEESKWSYLSDASEVSNLYKAILPDKQAGQYRPRVYLLQTVAEEIAAASNGTDIQDALVQARDLLADSIRLTGVVYEAATPTYLPLGHFDLSKIDYDALAKTMREGHCNLKSEQLRSQLVQKLEQMVKQNPTRVDYQEKLGQIVHRNNDNSAPNALYPQELIDFARTMHEEELRARREGLSEEGLAIFDLIIRQGPELSVEDKEKVKATTRALLAALDRENIGIDWQKKQETSGNVQDTIQRVLNDLPKIYEKSIYDQQCLEVFHYTLTHFDGTGKSLA